MENQKPIIEALGVMKYPSILTLALASRLVIQYLHFVVQTQNLHKATYFWISTRFYSSLNPFSTNVSLMDKPGCWFLLVKFWKTPAEKWHFK